MKPDNKKPVSAPGASQEARYQEATRRVLLKRARVEQAACDLSLETMNLNAEEQNEGATSSDAQQPVPVKRAKFDNPMLAALLTGEKVDSENAIKNEDKTNQQQKGTSD